MNINQVKDFRFLNIVITMQSDATSKPEMTRRSVYLHGFIHGYCDVSLQNELER